MNPVGLKLNHRRLVPLLRDFYRLSGRTCDLVLTGLACRDTSRIVRAGLMIKNSKVAFYAEILSYQTLMKYPPEEGLVTPEGHEPATVSRTVLAGLTIRI